MLSLFRLSSCGSLNVIDSHNFIRSGTLRICVCCCGCGLVGGSMLLWGRALRFPVLGILPSISVDFMLPDSGLNL